MRIYMEYTNYLKNPFIVGLTSGTIVIVLAYIDRKINKREFEKSFYTKLFLLIFLLSMGLVYITKMNNGVLVKQNNLLNGGNIIKKINQGGLDIFTDIPNF